MDVFLASLPFQRQRAEIQAGVHQKSMQGIGFACFAVVERKRADSVAAGSADRMPPARRQTIRDREAAVSCAVRVRWISREYDESAMGAGILLFCQVGADFQSIDSLQVLLRQAGRRQDPQSAVFVDPSDGGNDRWRDPLHLEANERHDLEQRLFPRHRIQHLVVKHLVYFRAGDIGPDAGEVLARAVRIKYRIDHRRYP